MTITAIIRAAAGKEDLVRQALMDVAQAVASTEPDTVGYYVSQSRDDPRLFTTFERFRDAAAMDRHNASAAVAKFVELTKGALDGPVILHACFELSARTPGR